MQQLQSTGIPVESQLWQGDSISTDTPFPSFLEAIEAQSAPMEPKEISDGVPFSEIYPLFFNTGEGDAAFNGLSVDGEQNQSAFFQQHVISSGGGSQDGTGIVFYNASSSVMDGTQTMNAEGVLSASESGNSAGGDMQSMFGKDITLLQGIENDVRTYVAGTSSDVNESSQATGAFFQTSSMMLHGVEQQPLNVNVNDSNPQGMSWESSENAGMQQIDLAQKENLVLAAQLAEQKDPFIMMNSSMPPMVEAQVEGAVSFIPEQAFERMSEKAVPREQQQEQWDASYSVNRVESEAMTSRSIESTQQTGEEQTRDFTKFQATNDAKAMPEAAVGMNGREAQVKEAQAIAQQMVKNAQLKNVNGVQQYTINLEPKYLGAIKLQISVNENSEVLARIVSDNPHTAEILQSNQQILKDTFAEAGVKMGAFEVHVTSDLENFDMQDLGGEESSSDTSDSDSSADQDNEDMSSDNIIVNEKKGEEEVVVNTEEASFETKGYEKSNAESINLLI